VAIFWLFYKLGQRSFVSTSPSYENAWTHEPIYGEHLSSITRGFEDNLRNMVRLGRSHGVPTLLITPVANLRDWEPNFSFFQKSTDPDLQREFLDQLDQGKQLLERGELVEAKTIFARLLVVEPGFAELQFSYGRLLEAQELYPEARSAYEQAAQFDGRPWRNLPEFAPLIREISAQEDTFLVDANSLFERESPHGLVGRNLIIDNCHPSLHGQFLIAREILVVLRAEQFLETVENEQIRTEEQYLRRLFPSTEARAESSYRTGSYVLTWVTLRKDPRLRLQQALADFDQALQYWPRYPEALYARAMTLKALGQSDLARQSEGLAFQLDPEIDRKAEHVTRLLSPMMRQ
jgi:tetratricopeptide (TPR) repeat protein